MFYIRHFGLTVGVRAFTLHYEGKTNFIKSKENIQFLSLHFINIGNRWGEME